jgi:hypothetical protein
MRLSAALSAFQAAASHCDRLLDRSHNAAASAGRQGYGKKHRLTLLAGCRRSADNLNAIEESVVGGVDNYVSSIRDDRKREPTFRVGPDCGPNRATVIVIE